ncbi:hypothetical protein D3C87_310230 [compost metagenome]
MSKLLFATFVSLSSIGFSQQRIGLELFSHLDDLSVGTHYQKVIYSKFIIGTGLIWINKRRGMNFQDAPGAAIYTALRDVPTSFDRNGEEYLVKSYRTTSKALMLTLNTGFFHEFGVVHGLRVNLNGRIGIAGNSGTYSYAGQVNDTIIPVRYSKNHLVTAVSPEIYHTLRQRKRWTFYYGLRFPVYFSLDKQRFNPQYRKEGFFGLEMEVALGITYFIGNKGLIAN